MRRTGLVLAGGASRRFGGNKPLAPLEGRPLVHWVSRVLASRCDELVLSIGAHDNVRPFQDAVPAARIAPDARADRGPVEGFQRGFEAARGDVVLVAPADAPFLQATLYDALLSLLEDHEAAVPRHASLDPVRAAYRRDAVLRALSGDVASPSALVDRLDAVYLEAPALRAADPSLASFIDINRREDLHGSHPGLAPLG